MSRYSPESARMSAGVCIHSSSCLLKPKPSAISTAHSTPVAISAVNTAVFICPNRFAPKSWEAITLQPMLQPNPKAMKIRVTS